MITIKDADASWQYGKVVSATVEDQRVDALIVATKEFATNALLLSRQKTSLAGKDVKFLMPKSFEV